MDERALYDIALIGIFAVAAITAAALFFITAPYGRHARKGWGPNIPSTVGWILMESPAVITIAVFFMVSDRVADPVSLVFLGMWQLHYLHRAFVFPLKRVGRSRPMPIAVCAMAVVFNIWNGYLNGRWLFHFGPDREVSWLTDPRFILGAILFATGMMINRHSDGILLSLRKRDESGYKIPRGGFFRWVTMPNYFGELLEWFGWALATWSLAGLSFAVFTAANLVPRAWSNRRWYRTEFPDYPRDRKAVIPFLF